MEYEDIPKYIKRYSFDSKMRACYKYSIALIEFLAVKHPTEWSKQILPWELETFLLFAVNFKEYQDIDILQNNERRYKEFINAIRKKAPNEQIISQGKDKTRDLIMMHLALIQFELQESKLYKYYRFNYFFSYENSAKDINMKESFFTKFGVYYNEVWSFGLKLNAILSIQRGFNTITEQLVQQYIKVMPLLTITRNQYRDLLSIYSKNINDYEFCLRPSYSYLFIEDEIGGVYMPLPHLLYRATTSSLLYRLTDSNLPLKDKIGRYLIQDYLESILIASKAYEEVVPEKKYKSNGTDCDTPDVMLRAGSSFLFFESKSTVPPMKMRIFDEAARKEHVCRLGIAVDQLYKQLKKFIDGEFNFFIDTQVGQVDQSHVWGVVTVLEESYVSREEIYDEFTRISKITKESEIFKWVISHIKIISLYDVEKFSFIGESIIGELEKIEDDKNPYEYALMSSPAGTIINPDVLAFKKNIKKRIGELKSEIK